MCPVQVAADRSEGPTRFSYRIGAQNVLYRLFFARIVKSRQPNCLSCMEIREVFARNLRRGNVLTWRLPTASRRYDKKQIGEEHHQMHKTGQHRRSSGSEADDAGAQRNHKQNRISRAQTKCQ